MIKSKIENLEDKLIEKNDEKISDLEQENKVLKEQIETMKKEIDDLRDAWNNEINLNSASENNDPLCPSCGHNLQCFDCGDLF